MVMTSRRAFVTPKRRSTGDPTTTGLDTGARPTRGGACNACRTASAVLDPTAAPPLGKAVTPMIRETPGPLAPLYRLWIWTRPRGRNRISGRPGETGASGD